MNKLTNTKNINNFSSEGFEWKQVQNEMKNKLGLEVYESWLKKISFVEEFNNYLLLSVPTKFTVHSFSLPSPLTIYRSNKSKNGWPMLNPYKNASIITRTISRCS